METNTHIIVAKTCTTLIKMGYTSNRTTLRFSGLNSLLILAHLLSSISSIYIISTGIIFQNKKKKLAFDSPEKKLLQILQAN